MKSVQVVVLALLLLCLIKPVAAAAATYYVNNSGSPACSDTGGQAGTNASPFCTMQYALSRMSSGDTMYVRAGSYTPGGGGGFWQIAGPSGTTVQHTVVSAYPTGTNTYEAVNLLPTDSNTKFRIGNSSGTTDTPVSNFDFVGFNIFSSGGFFMESGISVMAGTNIVLKNLVVHNTTQEGLHVGCNSSNVTIQGNTVYTTGTGGNYGEGIYVGSSTTPAFCTYADNTNNITIIGNLIHDTGNEGIELKPGTHNITVDGNTLYNNNRPGPQGGASIEVNEAVASPQHWDSNPNHIIRNNVVHDAGPAGGGDQLLNSGIRLGTGSTAYNNVIYNIASPGDGIWATSGAYGNPDTYSRNVYHNTIDVTSARAVATSGSPTTDIKNNIGPTSTNNMATSSAYYVSAATRDYHLVSGAAPIDAGLNLTATVPTDKDGVVRPQGVAPDAGAYEYAAGSRPSPPTNLTVIVQ